MFEEFKEQSEILRHRQSVNHGKAMAYLDIRAAISRKMVAERNILTPLQLDALSSVETMAWENYLTLTEEGDKIRAESRENYKAWKQAIQDREARISV